MIRQYASIAFVIVFLLTTSESLQAVNKGTSGDALVDSLIREVDRLYRSSTAYSELEMEIVTPHWQRTLSMKAWSEGMDKTLIRILSPRKEKGVTTLRIDNEMWNYLPRTNKTMKVPPSMMMGSWMGSDFTNDDLVKESSLFEDYTYEMIEPDSADAGLYYINAIPRPDLAVVWGNVVLAVEKERQLPVWQKFYDEKGGLMRMMTYSGVKELGGRLLPTVQEMIPKNKEGHKTVIRYTRAEFDVPLNKDTFSLRSLRSNR